MMRFIRFRLRTLLLLMSGLGAVGGWLVMHETEHRHEWHLIDEIIGKRDVPSTRFTIINENVAALAYDNAVFG